MSRETDRDELIDYIKKVDRGLKFFTKKIEL